MSQMISKWNWEIWLDSSSKWNRIREGSIAEDGLPSFFLLSIFLLLWFRMKMTKHGQYYWISRSISYFRFYAHVNKWKLKYIRFRKIWAKMSCFVFISSITSTLTSSSSSTTTYFRQTHTINIIVFFSLSI